MWSIAQERSAVTPRRHNPGMVDEQALARRARRQHGLVTRRQARAAGLTDRQVEHRVATGRWTCVRPGVYAGGWVPPSAEQAVLAVVLSVGQPCVASHDTAARLWGLPVCAPEAIVVATSAGRRVRLAGVQQHRPGAWFLEDVTVHRRVPVTTVAKTLVDCGGALRPDALGRAVDEALRRRLVGLPDLTACVERLKAVRARRLRSVCIVLAERGALPERAANGGELEVLEALQRSGLPLPVTQHRVVVGGRTRRLDFAYPEARIALEFDGFAEHGLLRSTFDDDRVRGNDLRLAGGLVLHFTSRSSMRDITETVDRALQQGRSA